LNKFVERENMNLPIDNEEESNCVDSVWNLITSLQPLLRNGVYLRCANLVEMDKIDDIHRHMEACVESFERLEVKFRQVRHQFYSKNNI